MTPRPSVVAFDVIGTIMSLEPLREHLPATVSLEAWYTRTIRDGMTLATTGGYADFPEVAAAALRGLSRYTVSEPQVADVMSGFAELPAFPDALAAMKTLREADVRVLCLTNGPAQFTGAFLDRTGLRRYVERVVSVADVLRWKPSGIVYRYAAEVASVPADQLALVSAHDWDCHGAKSAGLTTGWVSRDSGGYSPLFRPPDVTGADLTAVCAALVPPTP